MTVNINTLNAIMPSTITVSYPYMLQTAFSQDYFPSGPATPRFTVGAGSFYEKSIPLSTFTLSGTTLQGNGSEKVFHDTCPAIVCVTDFGTIQNQANLDALALQIARDYVLWQFEGLDLVLPGINPWQPDGTADVTYVMNEAETYTRVQRVPFNWEVTELQHFDTLNCPPPSSSSQASSSTSSSSSCMQKCFDLIDCNGDGPFRVQLTVDCHGECYSSGGCTNP